MTGLELMLAPFHRVHIGSRIVGPTILRGTMWADLMWDELPRCACDDAQRAHRFMQSGVIHLQP
jgi:hypothetical protein